MKLRFEIHYRTEFGQYIGIVEDMADKALWTVNNPLRLQCHGEDFWYTDVQIDDIENFRYRYGVFDQRGVLILESGFLRSLSFCKSKGDVVVRDYWQEATVDTVFLSKMFTQVLFRRSFETNKQKFVIKKPNSNKTVVHFSLLAPHVYPDQGVAIVGNIPELGNWDGAKKLSLCDNNFPLWEVDVEVDSTTDIEYKYCIFDKSQGGIVDYESGSNRYVWGIRRGSTIVQNDIHFRRTTPYFRGIGVSVPVFSLRTNDGLGIGEFLDLKKLVDWASMVGFNVIQTLPVNDTTICHTNKDSYPYSPVSVFALHPIYINIPKMGKMSASLLKEYNIDKELFNKKHFADYQNVYDVKMKYFKQIYKSQQPTVFTTSSFKEFYERNRFWLEDYSVFMSKRDGLSKDFFMFLQYHADKQLSEAVSYAHSKRVALKGDIPIGVDKNSAEVAIHPQLFNTKGSAGAPPDDFDERGQNWGFPTYNWDVMEHDNYSWWVNRLKKMEEYFDAYRIDHILGFFRIWQMRTTDVWGLCGHFSPSLPYSLQDLWNLGIKLDEDRMVKPYIRSNFIGEVFGYDSQYAIDHFLNTNDQYIYYFKNEFDTPQKIKCYFDALDKDKTCSLSQHQRDNLKNGLLYLHCEVLFVRDQQNPELLHPRVTLYKTHSFTELWADQKDVLMSIYNDYFYRRHDNYWRESALKKLPVLIRSNSMLCCGEDLGMMPSSVPPTIRELLILSLEVQRMPKDSTKEFAHPADAPYLSVCTTGTHDMSTLRAWWEENRDRTQRFYNQQLGYSGIAPDTMSTEITEFILKQHLYSPAMWVIIPLQDWLSIDGSIRVQNPQDERINIPSDPDHFWKYRMHIKIEDLLSCHFLNERISELAKIRK